MDVDKEATMSPFRAIPEFTHDAGVIIVLAPRPQLKDTFAISLTNKGFKPMPGSSKSGAIEYSEPFYLDSPVEYTESATEGANPVRGRIACVQLLSLSEFSRSDPLKNVDIFAALCALLAALSMRSQPVLGFLYLGESKTPRIGADVGITIELLAKHIIGSGRSQFAFVSMSWLERGAREAVLVNNETKIHSWLDQVFAETGPPSKPRNLQFLRLTPGAGSAANVILSFLDPASLSSKPLLQVQLPDKVQLSETSIGSELNTSLRAALQRLQKEILDEEDDDDALLSEQLDDIFQHHSGFLELHPYPKIQGSPEWSTFKRKVAHIFHNVTFILLFDRESTFQAGFQASKMQFPLISAGDKIFFILVPTFQDAAGDALILAQVFRCFALISTFNLKLLGIVYCWPDNCPRLKAEIHCNLKLLSKICGPDSLKSLVVLKSAWLPEDQNIDILQTFVQGAHLLEKGRQNTKALKATVLSTLSAQTKSNLAFFQEISGHPHLPLGETPAGLVILDFLTKELVKKQEDYTTYRRELSSEPDSKSLNPVWNSQINILFLQWGLIRFSGCINIYQKLEEEIVEDANIEKAIAQLEAVITLQSNLHTQKGHKLAQLGGLYSAHWELYGDKQDLSQAIKRYDEAIAIIDPEDPKKPEYLSILGSHFEKRFQLGGSKDDIVNAIHRCQEALQLKVRRLESASGAKSKVQGALAFHALAGVLKRKFESDLNNLGVAKTDIGDINQAIHYLHDAEGLISHGHQAASIIFSDLCHSHILKSQYYSYKNNKEEAMKMIEAAIDEYNKTLPEPGPSHPAYAMILNAKCQAYSKHYKLVKVKGWNSRYNADIQEAIKAGEEAVAESKEPSQECVYLLNLGKAYWYLHENLTETASTGPTADIAEALTKATQCFCQSAQYMTADHMVRFKSARNWAKVEAEKAAITKLQSSDSGAIMVLRAYEYCIVLLAEIAGEDIPLYEQYRRLEKIQKIVHQATSAAIKHGKLDKAVEFFEEGRSVIWKHYFKHDIIMHALKEKHPELAKEYIKHRTQLKSNALDEANSTLKLGTTLGGGPKSQAPKSNFLVAGLKNTWDAIKSIAEFASFGLYQKLSLLDRATEHGSIILINLCEKQCDALILQKKKPITHVKLDKMSSEIAVKLQENLREVIGDGGKSRGIGPAKIGPNKEKVTMQGILKDLWTTVANPVVKGLDKVSTPPSSHIFWCMSGPLSFLPIHAAGDYTLKKDTVRLLDFFHSSYIPNIFSLLKSSLSTPSKRQDFQLLAVAQSVTPGQSSLPKTVSEVNHLKEHAIAGKHTKVLINKEGTVERVKEELVKSQWAHFACHGVQDEIDGLKSALLLDEGKRLTLKELVELKIPHAEFAFLSACQSAKGDVTLPEEHIHLAAGMLTAGYQGVIATMWSIRDDDGVYIAKEVYNNLFSEEKKKGFTSIFRGGEKPFDFKKAVRALNEAIEKLRKEQGVDYVHWVPFVHIGL